jgi:hypothetical protein
MNRSRLLTQATAAWQTLATEPTVHIRPAPGLRITLSREDDKVLLVAIQEDHPIGLEDAEIIAAAFGVPPDAEPARSQRSANLPVTQRKAHLHIIMWAWYESVPRPLTERPAPAAALWSVVWRN